MKVRGGTLNGPFYSSERAPRPLVPVRHHPSLTPLALGCPGMGTLASRLTENRLVPDGLGCGPPSRALEGHSPLDGRASGPQPASCGRRAQPAPARAREKPPEGWRGGRPRGLRGRNPQGCAELRMPTGAGSAEARRLHAAEFGNDIFTVLRVQLPRRVGG